MPKKAKKRHEVPKTLVAFLWYFIKPYQWYVAGMMLSGLYWAASKYALIPYAFRGLINGIITAVTDKTKVFELVKDLVTVYILLWTLNAVNLRLLAWIELCLFPDMRQLIIQKMAAYLNRHSHRYFENNFSVNLPRKLGELAAGTVFIIKRLDIFFKQGIGLIIAFTIIFIVHPIFAELLLGWTMLFLTVTLCYIKKIYNRSYTFVKSKRTLLNRIVDSACNVMNVRLFARHHYEDTQIRAMSTQTMQRDRAMQWAIFRMDVLKDIAGVLFISGMLYCRMAMYHKNIGNGGDFAMIMSIAFAVFGNFWYATSQLVQFAEEIGKCAETLKAITKPHEITDYPDAQPLVVKNSEIIFDKVTFGYNTNNPVFKKISLTIAPGQKVGLVGFSGSGKSTFVSLILRLFDIQAGEIRIDGQNIAKVAQNSLHENIAMIPQDVSLFNRTLMEKIRYGRLDATDREVMQAVKQANIDISEMPNGYQSPVGNRGIKLSGGQRQRIAIARALLKNSPILILDEAMSSLDAITEKNIRNCLNTLIQGKTTIVIAHRLSTLAEMNRILVFDHGKIVEDGTHETLLKKAKGHYKRLYETQVGGFIPDS